MQNTPEKPLQNVIPNNSITAGTGEIAQDIDLAQWMEVYLHTHATTSLRSRKEQRRDFDIFLSYLQVEHGNFHPRCWSPRVSRDFQISLQTTFTPDGLRRWSDNTINRIIAHLKSFAAWLHEQVLFPLGQPMEKVRLLSAANQLNIERAITPQERNRILDAVDRLLSAGGLSKDRNRYAGKQPPQRKSYRPYRNRAIIYTLIETGMRRAAITRLNLTDIDFDKRVLSVVEKGGSVHTYSISKDGLATIIEYINAEREEDKKGKWADSPALFLPASSMTRGSGRLTPQVINRVWNEARDFAGVDKDKTPHSARHAMGAYIIKKTGNIAAVQRQLGHKNAVFSMQYCRVSNKELQELLDNR